MNDTIGSASVGTKDLVPEPRRRSTRSEDTKDGSENIDFLSVCPPNPRIVAHVASYSQPRMGPTAKSEQSLISEANPSKDAASFAASRIQRDPEIISYHAFSTYPQIAEDFYAGAQ